MDERTPTAWPAHRWLVLLLLAVAALRLWQLTHTEVLARDSIGFINLAWRLGHEPTTQVLSQAESHPGYPLLILAAAEPFRWWGCGPEAEVMRLAAQSVSALASVLLVVPMFYLGRALFNGRVAFWACLLFQFLPASGRVLGDGLAEATFLLFTMIALGLAWRALRDGSLWMFGLCGLSGGLAYLTRPEGALTVLMTAFVLLIGQAVASWRKPWRRVLLGGASLAVGAALIGLPVLALSGRVILKPSVRVLSGDAVGPVLPELLPADTGEPGAHLGVTAGPPWAVWWADEQDTGPLDWRWGLRALGYEMMKGFYYAFWLPALLGLVLWWRRVMAQPGAWVLLLVCLAIVLLLWRLASVMGYVSDRHILLLVLCGTFWSVATLEALGTTLARVVRHWVKGLSPEAVGRVFAAGFALLAVLTSLPKLIEPLHADRSGFREAGLWLADHVGPDDAIVDPYRWPSYYAGADFKPRTPPAAAQTRFLVLERSTNPHDHLALHKQVAALSPHGQTVYSWRGQRGKATVEIVIVALPGRL